MFTCRRKENLARYDPWVGCCWVACFVVRSAQDARVCGGEVVGKLEGLRVASVTAIRFHGNGKKGM